MATIAVTGANKGIGLELARQLAARGDDVIAAVRKGSDELEAAGVEIHDGVDVTGEASLARFARELKGRRVDILINNAGILDDRDGHIGALDWDAMQRQFEVNTLGPLRVTQALLPNLGAGAKVAIVSSQLGSIARTGAGGNYGYRISKAAVNMGGVCLAHDLKPKGIAVVLLHPGYVRTSLTGHKGEITPEESARGLIARIDKTGLAATGTFWHVNGEQLPW